MPIYEVNFYANLLKGNEPLNIALTVCARARALKVNVFKGSKGNVSATMTNNALGMHNLSPDYHSHMATRFI